MNRRDALKATVAGLAAVATAKAAAQSEQEPATRPDVPLSKKEQLAAPPCGLFCEACSEFTKNKCHGCGCDCGNCHGNAHACHMRDCAREIGVESCADCDQFPCTKLIMHTNDPIWRTHGACLENLRRRKVIGTKAWVAEQREYFADKQNLVKQQFLEFECKQRMDKLKQQGNYNKPW